MDGQPDISEQTSSMDGLIISEKLTEKAETVRALLKNDADVNAKDESGSTPLHLASSKGSYETMTILIEYGADVAAKDSNDRTAMHLAFSQVCVPQMHHS